MVAIGSTTSISVRSVNVCIPLFQLTACPVIVCDNGVSGFLGEHSCMDGTPTLRMNEFILASLAADRGSAPTDSIGHGLPEPKELKFVVDTKVQKAVDESCQRFDKLVGKHDLHVCPVLLSTLTFQLIFGPIGRYYTMKVMVKTISRNSKRRPMPGFNWSNSSLSTRCLIDLESPMRARRQGSTSWVGPR
jgi:hypothetical protein